MNEKPRLVLSYMGEDVYHRTSRDDDLRPACRPTRIRGVPTIRVMAERQGKSPCSLCWPAEANSAQSPHDR